MYLPNSDLLILYLPNELPTLSELRVFKKNVMHLVKVLGYKKVAINLSKLKYVDIRGVKLFIDIKNSLEEQGNSVVYFKASPTIIKMLLKSKLYNFIDIVNNEKALFSYFDYKLTA